MEKTAEPGTRDAVAALLLERRGDYVSGGDISRRLNLSRAAVWKHVAALREAGFAIDAATNRGYRLTAWPDAYMAPVIAGLLTTRDLGRHLHVKGETVSTNADAHALARAGALHGTAVIADTQTGGRGRRGRAWFSEPGMGLCMSLVLRPPIEPSLAPRYTIATALGLRRVLLGLDASAELKWPNDVLCGGKKIAGILLELIATMEAVDALIVGIGVNINQESFPADIANIATSVALATGCEQERNGFAAALLNALEPVYDLCPSEAGFATLLAEYREGLSTLGEQVQVAGVNERYEGVARDVDAQGRLILELESGESVTLHSGDVTLRPEK